MLELVIRWLIITAAVAVAAWLIPGIRGDDERGYSAVLIMGAVLAAVNLIVRPILTILSIPLILLTLGLFLIVINALLLWLASGIAADLFDAGFEVDGFWPAVWGSLVVSVVSWVMTAFVGEDRVEG